MAPQALKITRPSSPAPQLPPQGAVHDHPAYTALQHPRRKKERQWRRAKEQRSTWPCRAAAPCASARPSISAPCSATPSAPSPRRQRPSGMPRRQKRGQGMTGIMAIIVALVLLMVLAYRGLSLLILAPLLAALVAMVSVDTPLLASYTQVFMGAAGNFIVSFFPLFLLGAIFGKLMEDSGSAEVTLPPAERDLPPLPLALLPIVLVIALNLLFTSVVIPAMDTGYLAEPTYGATSIESVRGVWSVIAALVIAIAVIIVTNLRRLEALTTTLDSGANASLLPIFNTASLVGFGSVIASLAAFEAISLWVTSVGGDNPLISLAIAVNLLAGMTGSASGGMSIALATLGDTYLAMGQAAGIAPELLHRVTAVATGGLDALPHNGAVITLLSICGLTHRQAYLDIAVVAVVIPILSLVLLIALGTLVGSF